MVDASATATVTGTSAAAATAMAVATLPALPGATMKLLIDTKAKRVLYAEAGKEVVDFFFGILAMPISTIAKLLREDGAHAAGAANIYDSVEKMDPAYMKSSIMRDTLLNSHRYTLLYRPSIPVPQSPATTVPPPSTFVKSTTPTPTNAPQVSLSSVYTTKLVAPASTTLTSGFPGCGAARGGSTGGFVQSLVMYTIMDDLTIAPMSNISAMVLLSKLNGEDKGLVLEEKSVQIDFQEGLDILKALVRSNTVLTDVFLSKNTIDVSTSKKRKAGTSSGKGNAVLENDKIPDYYI